ncbi:MAG: GFA family protein [Phyllobacterium sp.]
MIIKGNCHCGATRFEVTEEPALVIRCNCSFCTKRGALHAYYRPDQFRLTADPASYATYARNGIVKHHHCNICGCATFTESPGWVNFSPDFENMRISVNARLFEDFDLAAVPVEHVDGRNLW